MGDVKTKYSDASKYYIEVTVSQSELDKGRYDRSKAREAKHNENWIKHKVNLNDIVKKFADGDRGERQGVKYVFKGSRYEVKADMASGYLRIYDRKTKKYVKLDGQPGTLEETHFKILKREEM